MTAPNLEYFAVIAEKLNMTAAAHSLHVSQQSLSAYIHRLEMYYGVDLFDRKPTLCLTKAGEAVYKTSQEIGKVHDRLLDTIDKLMCGANFCEMLSIGVFRPNANMLLNYIPMIEYNKRFPMISYTITEDSNSRLREMLYEGKLDLIISSYVPSTVFPELEEVQLYTDNENVLVSDMLIKSAFPDDFEERIVRYKNGVRLNELHTIPILMYPAQSKTREIIDRYFRDLRLKYSVVGESPDRFLTNSIVKSNVAMGFCSDKFLHSIWKTSDLSLSDTVHVFPIVEPDLQRTVGVLYRKKKQHPEFLVELIEMIRKHNAK